MALTYHMEGKHCTTKRVVVDSSGQQNVCYRAAEALYQQAMDLLEEDAYVLHPESSLVYLYLAICQNLIALYQGRSEDAVAEWEKTRDEAFYVCAEAHECPTYRFFLARVGMVYPE